jgi:type 1 glutamine amidotransferase
LVSINANAAQESKSKFNVVALAEHGGIHQPFVDVAKIWLQNLATDRNFSIDYINKSPRPNVHALARVNEDTYSPNTSIKMGGEHPVVWTNEHFKARNIYIFMRHHPELFQNASFTPLVTNSIFWAAQQ